MSKKVFFLQVLRQIVVAKTPPDKIFFRMYKTGCVILGQVLGDRAIKMGPASNPIFKPVSVQAGVVSNPIKVCFFSNKKRRGSRYFLSLRNFSQFLNNRSVLGASQDFV